MSRVDTEILTRLYQTEINNYNEKVNSKSSQVRVTDDKLTGRNKQSIQRWVLEGGQLVCHWIVKN